MALAILALRPLLGSIFSPIPVAATGSCFPWAPPDLESYNPNLSATASVLPLENVLRPDEAQPSLPTEDALSNAPAAAADQFSVSAVLEESP